MRTLIYTMGVVAAAAGMLKAEDRTVECRLITVVRGGSPAELFLDVAKGSGKRLQKMSPSASIEARPVEINVSDGKPLRFYDGRDGDATLIGEAGVPDGAESIVVLMLPDVPAEKDEKSDEAESDGKPAWRLVALDHKPEALKGGGVLVYNGRSAEAKVTVGDESRSLALGESETFGTPPSKDDFNMVPLRIEVLDGAKWRSLKDGTTRFVGEIAYWMILFDDPKVKRPQLRVYKVR